MDPAERPDAHEIALRALRRRDLSRLELDQRLRRAGVGEEERAETIERLVETGLVSDARYAEERARVLAARGCGDDAIRADLRRNGVKSDDVDAALETLEPEPDRAAAHFARRGAGDRALRYLAGKGFARDTLEALEVVDPLH